MPIPYLILPAAGADPADEYVRLGTDEQMSGQTEPDEGRRAAKFANAERHYRNALRLRPNDPRATQNLGILQATLGQTNEALLSVERAAMFDGVEPAVHSNRALMCLQTDRIDEALAAAEDALRIAGPEAPKDPIKLASWKQARVTLAMIASTAGHPQRSVDAYREVLAVEPAHMPSCVNVCFAQTLTGAVPADLTAQRKAWREANKPAGASIPPYRNDRDPDRPIRVGYVGGDFKRHSASMIFGNVVLDHDPAVVEVYLYSSLPSDPVNDPLTKRFMDAAGPRWRDVTALSDDDAAALIRQDKVDLLVDLAAHTNGGRLGIFLRKPAPVQLTGWGFAHGTGLAEIDWFLADPMAVPPEERGQYAEKILDVPCVVTYLPPDEYGLKGTSQPPLYKNDYFTFGSYARYEKLSDECLSTFAEIMRRVPDARMEFKDHAFRRPYSIRRIRNAMPDVSPERLLFSISTSHPDHLLAHQQCDLALDPFPHGGGVVGLEQLFMGVPLLTLYGKQPAGRSASSVLACMGRTDWIARSPEEYVDKAVEWAGRDRELAKARKTLRQELLDSPVCRGYRAAVEAAYQTAWKEWCSK